MLQTLVALSTAEAVGESTMDRHPKSVDPPACLDEVRPGSDVSFSLEGDDIVVWLDGEHDASNQALTAQTFTRAIEMGSAEVIVDMRCVEFMGAALISTLVRARANARSSDRSLRVRDPSRCAMRVLEICGLLEILSSPLIGEPGDPSALATWVEVPCVRRVPCESQVREASAGSPPATLSDEAMGEGRSGEAEPARAGR